MKIRRLTIQGFRGFNGAQTIDLEPRLTIIYAPNSYGKTSICEALEWLIYGTTTKVKEAQSKDEYKGSYRNRHLPKDEKAFVEVEFIDGDTITCLRSEVTETDGVRRFINGMEVEEWPFSRQLMASPSPFVLQHALKSFLLTTPDDRFQKFARLLGLEELNEILKNIVSLCTKPEAHLPPEGNRALRVEQELFQRVCNRPALVAIAKAWRRGADNLGRSIAEEARKRVPLDTPEESVFAQLLQIRDDAVRRFFDGRLTLDDFKAAEATSNDEDIKFFMTFLSEEFVRCCSELSVLSTMKTLLLKAKFYALGAQLLPETDGRCPYCGQPLTEQIRTQIRNSHDQLKHQDEYRLRLEQQTQEIRANLDELRRRLQSFKQRFIDRMSTFLTVKESIEELRRVLVPKHENHFAAVTEVIQEVDGATTELRQNYAKVLSALDQLKKSLGEGAITEAEILTFGEALVGFITKSKVHGASISRSALVVREADQVLRHELDLLAGTEDISLIVDLMENRVVLNRAFEIREILEGLKDLKKTTEQYVAGKMLEAIATEFSEAVMQWYDKIRTKGDPKVHFDGFDMERTRGGDFKGRRVKIKAKSYGKELVSAVSSLSESKLNALGLCVSIAINCSKTSLFSFLVIDDPIQSLDEDHESQFVQVIRDLVDDKGKQVIVLSHNKTWVDQLRAGCRSLSGRYYHITSYTEEGPYIQAQEWVPVVQRLNEVKVILEDKAANEVRLQHAEAEIRIAMAEIACSLHRERYGKDRTPMPSNVNAQRIRELLIACGLDQELVDQVSQAFVTIDDAHHAPKRYRPGRERINVQYAVCKKLLRILEDS